MSAYVGISRNRKDLKRGTFSRNTGNFALKERQLKGTCFVFPKAFGKLFEILVRMYEIGGDPVTLGVELTKSCWKLRKIGPQSVPTRKGAAVRNETEICVCV